MKPISLRMQAFGPYGGVAEVDFTRLATVGLFVVSGPTGAGKTSIFDAMTYALFNELPGERSGFNEFRSDHADPSLLCEVEFVFEADGDLWRVTRTPTQERAKKRGSGMATENARAVLERQTLDGWDGVASSLKAVTSRCESLVGLDANQFQRVVLLPQGQFQQVLKANSKDRRELLRTLFGSSLYLNIEEQLKERAKAGEQGLAQLAAKVQGHLEVAATSLESATRALDNPHAGAAEGETTQRSELDPDLLDREKLDADALAAGGRALRAGALARHTLLANQADSAAEAARTAVDRAEAESLRRLRRDEYRARLDDLARRNRGTGNESAVAKATRPFRLSRRTTSMNDSVTTSVRSSSPSPMRLPPSRCVADHLVFRPSSRRPTLASLVPG
ncbi:MAG: SMC family ATPase [Acidimicrobiales bacterium]